MRRLPSTVADAGGGADYSLFFSADEGATWKRGHSRGTTGRETPSRAFTRAADASS